MSGKKQIRENFRNAVFKRDGYRCVMCGDYFGPEQAINHLDAHHITDRNEMHGGGYVKENGISLCNQNSNHNCHLKAEQFHISGGQSHVPGFHPDELYAKVGSSKALADKCCQEQL